MMSEQFLNPEFNEAFVLFVMLLYAIFTYAGIRMRSPITFIFIAMSFIILLVVALYNLSILIFYISLLGIIITIAFVSVFYFQ